MKINEVIEQLRYLAEERRSFFHDDNDPLKDDEFFRKDHEALIAAIKMLGGLDDAEKRLELIANEAQNSNCYDLCENADDDCGGYADKECNVCDRFKLIGG